MSFKRSKNLGDIAEQLLIQELKQRKYVLDVGLNEDKSKRYEYDVWADVVDNEGFDAERKIVTFEIKYDLYASKSGNWAIEYWNSKKNQPSGIMATKADWWVHVVNEESEPVLYLATVVELKAFLDKNKPFRTISSGGDNNADLYLYKQEDIQPVFSLLSDLDL